MSSGYKALKEVNENKEAPLPNFKAQVQDQDIINRSYMKILDTLINSVKEMNAKISQLDIFNTSLISLLKEQNLFDKDKFLDFIGKAYFDKCLESENIFKTNYGLKEVNRPVQKGDVVLLNLFAYDQSKGSYSTENTLSRIFVEVNPSVAEDRFKTLNRFSDLFQNKLLGISKNEKIKSSFNELRGSENSPEAANLIAEIEVLEVLEPPVLN